VRGRAGGIGGPVDRISMRVLRSRVDAVMVGAGTVRSERINLGLPGDLRGLVDTPPPLGVVVSASGEVPLHNLVRNEDERLLFVVSSRAPEEAVRRLSERGEVRRVLPEEPAGRVYGGALSLLRGEYGVRRLLAEGGPRVNHALIGSNLVDELFLTFAPKLAGGPEPGGEGTAGILSGEAFEEPAGMRLLSVHESDGELYFRYSLVRDPTTRQGGGVA